MDEVLNLLENLMQQVMQAQDEFSDEELQQFLKIFQDAVQALSEKGQEGNAQGLQPESTPSVPAGEHPSSNVNGFKFDPSTGKLLIQFHGPYPQAEGPVYEYEGVPKYMYDILHRGAVGPRTSGGNRYHNWVKGVTPSYGAVVNALIKAGGFPYRKIKG